MCAGFVRRPSKLQGNGDATKEFKGGDFLGGGTKAINT